MAESVVEFLKMKREKKETERCEEKGKGLSAGLCKFVCVKSAAG